MTSTACSRNTFGSLRNKRGTPLGCRPNNVTSPYCSLCLLCPSRLPVCSSFECGWPVGPVSTLSTCVTVWGEIMFLLSNALKLDGILIKLRISSTFTVLINESSMYCLFLSKGYLYFFKWGYYHYNCIGKNKQKTRWKH